MAAEASISAALSSLVCAHKYILFVPHFHPARLPGLRGEGVQIVLRWNGLV